MRRTQTYKKLIAFISVIVLFSTVFYIGQNTFLDDNINQKQRRTDKKKAEQRSQKKSSSDSQKDTSFLGTSKTVEDTRDISQVNSSKKSKKSSPDGEQQNNSASKKQVSTPEKNQNNNQSQDAQKDESKDNIKPQITITSPQNRVIWRENEKYMLKWKGDNLSNNQLSIVLTKSNEFCGQDQTCRSFVSGGAPQYILDKLEASEKQWTWEIPSLNGEKRTSGVYTLLLQSEKGQTLATSPPVAIMKKNAKSFISLKYPFKYSKAVIREGDRPLIAWETSPDISKVTIKLLENEKELKTIAKNIQNKHMISWNIPENISKGTYTLQVTSQNGVSDKETFKIKKKDT